MIIEQKIQTLTKYILSLHTTQGIILKITNEI